MTNPYDTHVIILAQGSQKRLGTLHDVRYKQLLPLPACGVSILERTVRQVYALTGFGPDIVTWADLRLSPEIGGVRIGDTIVQPGYVELPDPGNSSLKGIARYFELEAGRRRLFPKRHTMVLLGDVVYSWAALEAIWRMSHHWGFVGTPDLSSSGGELWGVGWSFDHDDWMMTQLRDALLRHPPLQDVYQPGQLRRWISGSKRGDIRTHIDELKGLRSFVAVDDYTMDVDLPGHIMSLGIASMRAATDDKYHGIDWQEVHHEGLVARQRIDQ